MTFQMSNKHEKMLEIVGQNKKQSKMCTLPKEFNFVILEAL